MGYLEEILPNELKARAIVSGNELVFAYSDATEVIRIAAKHQIAVLGLEAFEIRKDSLLTVDYSGYDRDIEHGENWTSYSENLNAEAEEWVGSHRFGANHGYVLTSASETEFTELKKTAERWKKKSLISKLFGVFH